MEKRLKTNIPAGEYGIYLSRFVQAFCRMVCSQEIMHASDTGIKYTELKKRLEAVCTHEKTAEVLETYPIGKLPFKQAVFAFAMKHKLYMMQKIIVNLRSR